MNFKKFLKIKPRLYHKKFTPLILPLLIAIVMLSGCSGKLFEGLTSDIEGLTSDIEKDTTPPTIKNVFIYDCDNNGNIDEVVFEFSESLNDSTIADSDAANFTMGASSFISVDPATGGAGTATGITPCSDGSGAGQDPGTANDEFITLFTNNRTLEGTETKEIIYTAATGRLQDSGENDLAGVTIDSTDVTDKAAPVIVKASGDTGQTSLIIQFSENVKTDSGSGVCNSTATDLATGDFAYIDISGNGVASLSGISEANGCDDSVITLTANTSFITEDIFIDTIAANADQIYDLAGNAADTTAQQVKGIIHPYVVNVVSVNSTTLKITFSEDVEDGTTGSGALNLNNYCFYNTSDGSYVSGTDTCTAGTESPAISGGVKISDSAYAFTTTAQNSSITYALAVRDCGACDNIKDIDEGSTMVDPKLGTFIGNEKLKVVSAEAVSLYTFMITFSKDVKESGIGGASNTSYYTIADSLGNVTTAVRQSEANKVLVSHSTAQGVGIYSVIVSTDLKNSDDNENLDENPKDRTTFMGFGGNIETLEDGSLFTDPFADGTSFAFAFVYRGKVYLGPNDATSGVFRFDPDGSNSTLVTFNNPGTGDSKLTFGSNITRPVTNTTASGGTIRYTFVDGTDISPYFVGNDVEITSCTNANNNRTTTISDIDSSNNYIEIADGGTTGVTSTTETCSVFIYTANGADENWSGVNSFTSIEPGVCSNATYKNQEECETNSETWTSQTYLAFGGAKFQGINQFYLTADVDTILDNTGCDIASATLGNAKSHQTIYVYNNYIYFGFASDTTHPVFGYVDISTSGAPVCGTVVDSVSSEPTGLIAKEEIGSGGGNTADQSGIDSIIVYDNVLYLGNNAGIIYTPTIPPSLATWTQVLTDGTIPWDTGTTQVIQHTGKLRPGEKGVPFMVVFNGALYIARNRSDDNTAELWRCTGTCTTATNWSKVFDTAESEISTGTSYNTDISMVKVVQVPEGTDKYLYVGFDNATNGAEVFYSTDGDNFTKLGESGLGPATGADLTKNKHIISNASVFYDGKNYLYITIGCQSDYSDNGACDGDSTVGATDFSIKVFRQIDE